MHFYRIEYVINDWLTGWPILAAVDSSVVVLRYPIPYVEVQYSIAQCMRNQLTSAPNALLADFIDFIEHDRFEFLLNSSLLIAIIILLISLKYRI